MLQSVIEKIQTIVHVTRFRVVKLSLVENAMIFEETDFLFIHFHPSLISNDIGVVCVENLFAIEAISER
jgi:hypothetical protein